MGFFCESSVTPSGHNVTLQLGWPKFLELAQDFCKCTVRHVCTILEVIWACVRMCASPQRLNPASVPLQAGKFSQANLGEAIDQGGGGKVIGRLGPGGMGSASGR